MSCRAGDGRVASVAHTGRDDERDPRANGEHRQRRCPGAQSLTPPATSQGGDASRHAGREEILGASRDEKRLHTSTLSSRPASCRPVGGKHGAVSSTLGLLVCAEPLVNPQCARATGTVCPAAYRPARPSPSRRVDRMPSGRRPRPWHPCARTEDDAGRHAEQPTEDRGSDDDPDDRGMCRAHHPAQLDLPRVGDGQGDQHDRCADQEQRPRIEAPSPAMAARALLGRLAGRRDGLRCGGRWAAHDEDDTRAGP